MRRIVTALAVIAFAFSLAAQATPARAVAGYDSAYSGESAFLTLSRGESGSFTVFFANTGSATWTLGTGAQVDLAACREDKVTCDAQDSGEAEFESGWRSATRYATHTQTSVSPGQIATFTYSVEVPSDAAAGTYGFNGALVLSATGEDIRNEGYFQDVTVTVASAAATVTDLDPEEGAIEGGDAVVITGSGFECSPEPTVLFGSAEGDVQSCAQTTLNVDTPAHDAGTVDVTVTNAGAAASNALQFEFVDDARPTFESVRAEGQTLTLTFNEPVCADNGTLTANTELRVRVDDADVSEDSITFADCDDDEFSATATLTISDQVDEGAMVSVTITTTGADDIFDQDDNAMDLGETQTTVAEADDTDPTIETVTAVDEQVLEVEYSEPVECAGTDRGQFVFNPDEADAEDVVADDVDCDGSAVVSVEFPTNTFAAGVTGVLEYTADDDRIEDPSGNIAPNEDVTIVPTQMDKPTIDEASVTDSAGFRNSADKDDEITIIFNEVMNNSTSGDRIRVQDDDGTIADLSCTSVATADDDKLDAECDYDGEELVITLLEDATGELIADGDTSGLQWPAEIIDTASVTDEEGEQVDLDASTDTEIE